MWVKVPPGVMHGNLFFKAFRLAGSVSALKASTCSLQASEIKARPRVIVSISQSSAFTLGANEILVSKIVLLISFYLIYANTQICAKSTQLRTFNKYAHIRNPLYIGGVAYCVCLYNIFVLIRNIRKLGK